MEEKDPQPEDSMELSEMAQLSKGPMAPIVKAVYEKQPIIVSLRSNRKLHSYIKAVDRHWNMILEQVLEITPQPPAKPGMPVPEPRRRKISRLFLRGDNVICVFPNPQPPSEQ